MMDFLDTRFPTEWTRMFYETTGPNPDDRTCWIKHVNVLSLNEVVRSVCTPSEAEKLVEEHNKKVATDD